MTATHISGPHIVYGQPYDQQAQSAGGNPEAGPSVTYQGDSILDVRVPYQPGISGIGRVPAFASSPVVVLVDAAPASASPSLIAPPQPALSGAALVLAGAVAPGIAPNVPVLPNGSQSTAAVVPVLGLDMRLATVSSVAGSPIVTLSAPCPSIVPGVNLLVLQGSLWIGVTVLAVNQATGAVTLDTALAVTAAGQPVISGNGTGQRGQHPTYWTPYLAAGTAALFDPTQGLCRGLSVTSSSAADAGWTLNITGFDLYGSPMSESIPVNPNGVAYGRKAFKFVAFAVPGNPAGGATAGTLSVGTSDLVGFALRSDKWEYMDCFWGGTALSTSAGYTPADPTAPATSSTGDVRGTLQLSAAGHGAAYAAGGPADGAKRLVIVQTLAPSPLIAATPRNPAPLFGVAQA